MEGKEEPRPGNYDRAWNDPPLFSYNNSTAKSDTSAAKLNKRVEFPTAHPGLVKPAAEGSTAPPLHDAGAKSKVTSALPPPPPPSSKISDASPVKGTQENVMSDSAAKASVADVIVHLETFLNLKSTLDDRKKADLSKRIKNLETKWTSGGLNDKVESGMGTVARLLGDGEAVKAESVLLSLMVDWPAQCNPWAIGIKHLVANAKEVYKPGGQKQKEQNIMKPL